MGKEKDNFSEILHASIMHITNDKSYAIGPT